jgi:uncharacterized protein YbcI
MTADEKLVGGRLNAALTRALVGIQMQYLGRGPKTASTFHYNNVVVTLMHDVLTAADKLVAQTHRRDAIVSIRHLYQEAMQDDFNAAVERLTEREVVAFISGNHIEPDIAAEIFILDTPIENLGVPSKR